MKRQILDTYSGPWTPGIDLSAYQPDVDWRTVARSELYSGEKRLGVPRFAIVRSGDGVQTRSGSKPDPWAVRHLAGAADAGLLVSLYHFVRAWHSAEQQMEIAFEVARVAGVRVSRIWLDKEGRRDDPKTRADEGKGAWWAPGGTPPHERPTTDDVLDVFDEAGRLIEAEGMEPGIYTGVAWHERVALPRLERAFRWKHRPLWTPFYSRGSRYRMPAAPGRTMHALGRAAGWPEPWPWSHATIWQCGGSQVIPGRVAGIDGVVDANLYRGDEQALRAWWDAPAARRCP